MTMNLWLCLAVVCTFAQSIHGAVVPETEDTPDNEIVANVDEGDLGSNNATDPNDDGHWDGTQELDQDQEDVITINSGLVRDTVTQLPDCVVIEPVETETDGTGDSTSTFHYLDTNINIKCNRPEGVETIELGNCVCPDALPRCITENQSNLAEDVYYCLAQKTANVIVQSDDAFYGDGLPLGINEEPIIGTSKDLNKQVKIIGEHVAENGGLIVAED